MTTLTKTIVLEVGFWGGEGRSSGRVIPSNWGLKSLYISAGARTSTSSGQQLAR
jgi:hypothetical protein